MRLCVLLLLCLTTTLCVAITSADLSPTLGVATADLKLYKSKSDFTCRSNPKRTISRSQVNDDYCDCPEDGSDEPGTSACSRGSFFCINKGHRPEIITSSKVNDGICDCCDGSDEHQGRVKCKNDCNEKGVFQRKADEEHKKSYEEGVRLKREWARQTTRELQAKREELALLQSQVEGARAEAAKLEETKKEVIERENEQRKQLEEKQKETNAQNIPPPPPVEEEAGNEEAYEEPDPSEITPDQRAAINEELKPITTEKEAAVEAWEKARDRLGDMERQIRDTELLLAKDFGANSEFYYLHEKCFEHKTKEYTYTVCPYKTASQGSTSLGTWDRWEESPTPGGVPVMLFSNGQSCWGGPKRSLRVAMQCGDHNALLDFSEPSKCEYAASFVTPLACDVKHLEFLRLNQADDWHALHDEL